MNTQSSTKGNPAADDCGCGGGQRSVTGFGTSSTAPGVSKKSGGCGCGGGCGGTCGCGGSCGGVSGGSAFVRPRFFGGMLLTEDDLQAIDDYTVAKRRLTNRHMFGPGVVCGLDVDCDPCRPGWITVSPGYALDCCGNDIVLGCPEKLDALALLSDLRRSGGLDCGDPCDNQPERGYLLVVSYAEQPTDPVAPYAQDDCAVGDCDFSRVREGYRFELVCDVQDPDPNLFDRLGECAKEADSRGAQAAKLIEMAHLAKTQVIARAAEATGEAPVVAIPVVADFEAAPGQGIAHAVDLLGRSTAVLAAAEAHDAKLGPSIGLTESRRKSISERSRKLAEELLGSDELKELPQVDRQRATVVLEAARAQQNLGQLGVGQRVWLAEGYEAADAARVFTEQGEIVRSAIYRRLEETGRGSCREREEVGRLSFRQLDASSGDTVYRLAQSYWSIIVGCLCDNVNPPCPRCTETRVPLAVVKVEGCEVVDVCGLARQWVLAPRTLNYWLPVVDELRQLLLGRCCGTRKEFRPTTSQEVEALRERGMHALSLVRSPLDAPEFRPLWEVLQQLATPVAAAQAAEPVSTASASTAAPAPGGAAMSAEAQRVETLEHQVGELREQVRKLTGGDGP